MESVHEISTTNTSIDISRMGIRFSGEISSEQWEALGVKLSSASRSLGFMIGDWVNAAVDGMESDDRFGKAIEMTGLDYNTIQRFCRVASLIEIDSRIESLSWEHHRIVSTLPPVVRDEWLALAAKHGMSKRRLQRSLNAGRVVDVDEMKAAPSQKIETVHPFVNRTVGLFVRWKKSGWLKKQSPDQLQRLRADLEPVVAIYKELGGDV